jgi:hypothetical protein
MATSTVMRKLSIATAGAAFIALGTIGTAQAATLIDTTPSWDGNSSISYFGQPNTATYGQTFTVGSDNVLDSFSFFLNQASSSALKFAAYVMQWDGSKATGPILYQSGPESTTQQNVLQQFTFNTGGTSLVSGNRYVAFVNASNFPDSGFGSMGTQFTDAYPGGGFVYQNNGSNFSSLTTNNWNSFGPVDVAFKASLSSKKVPEPTSVLSLLAVGAMAAGSTLKRKLGQNAEGKSVN